MARLKVKKAGLGFTFNFEAPPALGYHCGSIGYVNAQAILL
jgi:hypothetical protein